MRTATLDLNSRGSFVDDLNSRPGIVMCRDSLLDRSHEIQPASSDSEKRFFLFSLFFVALQGTCLCQVLSAVAIFVFFMRECVGPVSCIKCARVQN